MKLLDNKEVGKSLKRFREKMHIRSARKFAIDAGLDQSHYSKVERGELPITDAMLEKLELKYGLNKEKIIQDLGIDVPRNIPETLDQEVSDKKLSLEKSIELLSEDRSRVLFVIERLTTLLEKQYSGLPEKKIGEGVELDIPGAAGTETKSREGKRVNKKPA